MSSSSSSSSSSPQSGSGVVAVVTGATGFIASVLIDALLKRGYTVRGTVRALPKDVSTVASDEKLASFYEVFKTQLADGSLKLFEADLLKEGTFQQAIEGSTVVFHTASPFFTGAAVTDPQKQLVDPAVNGTQNVVSEALKSPSVKRIIVTSSVAAVRGAPSTLTVEGLPVYSDADWNLAATLTSAPYPLSKVLAEKKAWQLVQEHNEAVKEEDKKKTLVTINPAYVFGPPLHKRNAFDSESMGALVKLFNGSLKKGALSIALASVDVRDVASAHIAAFENPSANGRYIVCTTNAFTQLDWARILRTKYPEQASSFPEAYANKNDSDATINRYHLDTTKAAKELKLKIRGLDEQLTSAVDALVKFGVIKL